VHLDPTIVKEKKNASSGKWTAEEDAKLIDAVVKCGKDWSTVAMLVPGRTKAQCCTTWEKRFNRPIKNERPTRTGTWTTKEDAKLIDAITKCGKDWVKVSALVPGRTNEQCRRAWTDRLIPTDEGALTRMGYWTTEEDAKMIEAVKKCGKDWLAVAALVPGRTNKQCHNRWTSHVHPTTKRKNRITGKWTLEEDSKLINAVTVCWKDWGRDWVAVAALVPDRTNTQCCTRWKRLGLDLQHPISGKRAVEEGGAKLLDAIGKHGNEWVTAIPVAKRPRLETYIPTSADAVVDVHMAAIVQ
jgi:hypothetical protein